MNEQEISRLVMFFNRMPCEWWLIGKTLIYWIKNRKLKFFDTPGIAVSCTNNIMENYMRSYDSVNANRIKIGSHVIRFEQRYIDSDVLASLDEIEKYHRRQDFTSSGLWSVNIAPESPYRINIPFRFGTMLDKEFPLWWLGNDKSEYFVKFPWFTKERKYHGYELLQLMLNCGERAGMRTAMWLGFGNLLGYVTVGDFLPHDNDMDICIDSEKSTHKSDLKYLEEIKKPFSIGNQNFPHGLCEKMYRQSNLRDDTGRPVWISLGHRSISRDNGVKSCHWWWFKHSNYYWHSKGDRWITNAKSGQVSSSDKAMALGIPEWILSEMVEVDFHGVNVNMPKYTGSALDFWYPGWCSLGIKCSSAKQIILAIGDWKNKKTWRIV